MSNTNYIHVEPLPPATSEAAPVAPASSQPALNLALSNEIDPALLDKVAEYQAWKEAQDAPTATPSAQEVPEWEREVPPPAIAHAQPAQSIDGAAYRAQMRGAQASPSPSSAPPPHTPRPPVPSGFGVQTPNYSPFRDDSNSYGLVVEHRGINYYLKEMDDKAQDHTNTFERRFVADLRNRVVDVAPDGPEVERSIAIEEVVGGVIEWYGQKEILPAGAVYQRFPHLKGHLTVRHLAVEEAGNETALIQRYPSTYKKLVAAREVMYEEVLEQCLMGWSVENVEVNRQNINRLVHEVKRTLFLRLGAGSVMGLNEADFFRRTG